MGDALGREGRRGAIGLHNSNLAMRQREAAQQHCFVLLATLQGESLHLSSLCLLVSPRRCASSLARPLSLSLSLIPSLSLDLF